MSFVAAPEEAETAYREACSLSAVHTGAAGAYARRALELLLDNMGYTAKTLADSIKLVAKESDPDKRLPRSLLTQLDYIREIGNFALHVRRDGELAIVEISDAEVATCLEAIEELIAHWYVGPVEQYLKVQALNNKLQSAGKPAIGLPLLPPGIDPAIISPPPSPPEGESASSPPEVEDAPSSTSLTSK
jgi:hypothetical protein